MHHSCCIDPGFAQRISTSSSQKALPLLFRTLQVCTPYMLSHLLPALVFLQLLHFVESRLWVTWHYILRWALGYPLLVLTQY